MIRYHFGLDDAQARVGKRLRPRLLLDVVEEEGAPSDDGLDAAVAIEVVHNYSLVHDDIEDGDEMRHGRTTVWKRYGLAHGINAGDAMCALAYLTILESASLPPDRTLRLATALHRANFAMCGGQALDIGFERADSVSMDEYVRMIAGKTAALFGAACEMGAICAGGDRERAEGYRQLGEAYGLAFQIRDDILGSWGATERTGKPSGADIARRKWSFPVVWALGQSPSDARDVVARAYSAGRSLAESEVAAVIAALDALGARDAADRACDTYLARAEQLAHERGLDPRRRVRDLFTTSARRVA